VLFLFGGNKPARFHGDAWLAAIDAKRARGDGSAWREIKDAGHWFAVERADETFEALDRWLRETNGNKNASDETASEGGAEGGRLRSAL
jgi:pimeloyl-ACP methyl ester carboxylesterase